MRIVSFITILILAHILPWWLLLVIAFLYALFFTEAHELILIGIFIDVTFGVLESVVYIPFFYTILMSVLVLIAETMKPHMLFYEQEL